MSSIPTAERKARMAKKKMDCNEQWTHNLKSHLGSLNTKVSKRGVEGSDISSKPWGWKGMEKILLWLPIKRTRSLLNLKMMMRGRNIRVFPIRDDLPKNLSPHYGFMHFTRENMLTLDSSSVKTFLMTSKLSIGRELRNCSTWWRNTWWGSWWWTNCSLRVIPKRIGLWVI